ncbi:MAG: multidrug ABC transporter [Coriobacteriales bacterium]|jgi:multidrug transporter EmrE-like cation transporter
MSSEVLAYSTILLVSVFISSVSQVLLKKSALKTYDSPIKEYLNPLVIFAYALFLGTTLLSVLAYRGIPLSLGPVLEATGYIYVTVFGVLIFKERITRGKLLALALIVAGIAVYAAGL